MRKLAALALLGLGIGAGAVLALRLVRPAPPALSVPAVVEKVRETARLETLELSLYRKISFAPEPVPQGSVWGDLLAWARQAVRPPRGRAIVFARARLGLDLGRLDPTTLRVEGREVWVALPPLEATVELLPGETEVVESNLDSAETAQLLELARVAFAREVEADARLRERALSQAERAIRELLLGLGFAEVHFVERLPGRAASGSPAAGPPAQPPGGRSAAAAPDGLSAAEGLSGSAPRSIGAAWASSTSAAKRAKAG